jgi:hypothetical protein
VDLEEQPNRNTFGRLADDHVGFGSALLRTRTDSSSTNGTLDLGGLGSTRYSRRSHSAVAPASLLPTAIKGSVLFRTPQAVLGREQLRQVRLAKSISLWQYSAVNPECGGNEFQPFYKLQRTLPLRIPAVESSPTTTVLSLYDMPQTATGADKFAEYNKVAASLPPNRRSTLRDGPGNRAQLLSAVRLVSTAGPDHAPRRPVYRQPFHG